jgi:molybdopterin-guanine dinucleotide biosynthesis protein A
MTTRAALILSGGNAKRFQTANQPWTDKALAQIDGKPLLLHVIENLKSTVDRIVVCVNDQQRATTYRQLLGKHAIGDVEFVVDQKGNQIKGPLLAITSGLAAVDTDYCLVVPTDMPFLSPKVADYLFKACVDYDAAVPMWPDGTVETLLMALERSSCLEIAHTLLALNRANVDSIIRAAGAIHLVSPLKEICSIDAQLRSFVNINSQEDLAALKTRSTEGSVRDDVCFEREKLQVAQLRELREAQKLLAEGRCFEVQNLLATLASCFEVNRHYFWAAVSEEKLAEAQLGRAKNAIAKQTYQRAAENYAKEATVYEVKGCKALAERAQSDRKFCLDKIGV